MAAMKPGRPYKPERYATVKQAVAHATELEEALKKINDALFPKPGLMLDADAYYNLEGALIDMRRSGEADKVCINTVARVQKQISAVSKVLKKMGIR
jgi:hypothetical protein